MNKPPRVIELRVVDAAKMKRAEELNAVDDGAWGWAHFAGLPPLHKTWTIAERTLAGVWLRNTNGLRVYITWCIELDGKRWLHVSLSRASTLPTYDDMCFVKKALIGRDKTAYQLFVPEREHISTHDFCLHLWHCVDGDPLPDFTKGTNQI